MVDGTGKYLMPGMIDCHSHTAIEGGVNEGTVSDSSMVNIKDVIDPTDINIYRGLAGGLDGLECAAWQRECDRRPDGGDQAAMGQDARRR